MNKQTICFSVRLALLINGDKEQATLLICSVPHPVYSENSIVHEM